MRNRTTDPALADPVPDTIACPECGSSIPLTEALSSGLRAELRVELEADVRSRETTVAAREAELRRTTQALAAERRGLEEELERRLAAGLTRARTGIEKEAAEQARAAAATQLEDLRGSLERTRGELAEARQQELDLRARARKLEEDREALELTIARRMDEERTAVRQKALREAAEETKLRAAEKEQIIDGLRRQIEELRRKADQGSQQLQGEVMEQDLEALLSDRFPRDRIEPVRTGARGADVLQHVHDEAGRHCGTILWESKRTRTWSAGWLPKLRNDQRTARADLAALVTTAMPDGLTTFGRLDDVWVTGRACAVGMASALRAGLVEIARTQRAHAGRADKMVVLYEYLAGTQFRRRVEGIVEAFVTMQTNLQREKRTMLGLWSKREKEIDRAIENTVGMYGDFEGLMGGGLPPIDGLSLEGLEPAALPPAGPAAAPEARPLDGVEARAGGAAENDEDDDAGRAAVAGTATRLRDAAPLGAAGADDDAAAVIVRCLRQSDRALSRGEVLARTRLTPGAWTPAIRRLVSSGRVEQMGARRGARYRASANGAGA